MRPKEIPHTQKNGSVSNILKQKDFCCIDRRMTLFTRYYICHWVNSNPKADFFLPRVSLKQQGTSLNLPTKVNYLSKGIYSWSTQPAQKPHPAHFHIKPACFPTILLFSLPHPTSSQDTPLAVWSSIKLYSTPGVVQFSGFTLPFLIKITILHSSRETSNISTKTGKLAYRHTHHTHTHESN